VADQQAMSGDVGAVVALLRIQDERMRLLGLYPKQARRDPKAGWDHCQGVPTVVVRADDCRHEGCKRHGKFAIPRTPVGLLLIDLDRVKDVNDNLGHAAVGQGPCGQRHRGRTGAVLQAGVQRARHVGAEHPPVGVLRDHGERPR